MRGKRLVLVSVGFSTKPEANAKSKRRMHRNQWLCVPSATSWL